MTSRNKRLLKTGIALLLVSPVWAYLTFWAAFVGGSVWMLQFLNGQGNLPPLFRLALASEAVVIFVLLITAGFALTGWALVSHFILEPTANDQPATPAPTMSPLAPVRRAVERVVDKLDEKLVEPTVRPTATAKPEEPQNALAGVARALDARAPKAPPIRITDEQIYLLIDHQTQGPFPCAEVLRRLQEGTLPKTVLCRPSDTLEWQPITILTEALSDNECSVCRRPASAEDHQPDGKLVCERCRQFMPKE